MDSEMAFAGFVAKCVLKTTVESPDAAIECKVDLLLEREDRAGGPLIELWLSPEEAAHFHPGELYSVPLQPVTPS